MDRFELIKNLVRMLLEDMPQYKGFTSLSPGDHISQRQLLRSLMNVRPDLPLKESFIEQQDLLLSMEREECGVIDISLLEPTSGRNIYLWRGDIVRLKADVIVNAANNALLGCFHPGHGCIDNAIHSAAGLQLRAECSEIIKKQGFNEPAGKAKITKAYNLPSEYIIHTVGPIIRGPLQEQDCRVLASCYESCMELAEQNNQTSIAFCCISTGEYGFPAVRAAVTAVDSVRGFMQKTNSEMKVIFNVFRKADEAIYRRILVPD